MKAEIKGKISPTNVCLIARGNMKKYNTKHEVKRMANNLVCTYVSIFVDPSVLSKWMCNC